MATWVSYRKLLAAIRQVESELVMKRFEPSAHLVQASEEDLLKRLEELKAAAEVALAELSRSLGPPLGAHEEPPGEE